MELRNMSTVASITDQDFNATIFSYSRTTILSTIEAILDGASAAAEAGKNVVPNEQSTPSSHKTQLLLYDVLIPTLGAIAIILNLAVVISSGLILKTGQQPRSTYMFLGNLAMADLVTAIAIVFGQLYPKSIRDHYVCATQIGMIVSSTLASVYSVGLIAIDRYLFILHGLQYQRWVFPTRVRIFILATWIIGCVIGFLPLMGWYGDTDNGRVCWFILLAPKELILITVIIGIIPLLVVIILYSVILYRALRRIIQLQEADTASAEESNRNGLRIFRGKASNADESQNAGTNNANSKPPNKWKAIKVVLFTTGSFIVTWSPYFIASLTYAYCYDKESPRCNTLRILIASPLAILGFLNSLINPIIYSWWHKGFRTFIKKKIQRIRMARRATQDITGNSRSTSTAHSSLGTKVSSSSNMESIQLEPDSDHTKL